MNDDTGRDDAPSRVGPGLLGVLAILPTLALLLLMPAMVRETEAGAMQPLHLSLAIATVAALPAGVAAFFFGLRRFALGAFVLAVPCALAALGSPYGRVLACAAIVAAIGAAMAFLRRD